MLGNVGWPELLVLLVVVLLIFGTKKLRTLGGDLGSSIKEFKKALNADTEEKPSPSVNSEVSADDQRKPS